MALVLPRLAGAPFHRGWVFRRWVVVFLPLLVSLSLRLPHPVVVAGEAEAVIRLSHLYRRLIDY